MIFKLTPMNRIRWEMWVWQEYDKGEFDWQHIGNPSCKTDIATLIAYTERKRK